MDNFGQRNMQKLCRACLKTLEFNRLNSIKNTSANSLLAPNLCKLFIFLTSYDVNEECDEFPKSLCELCHARILDYDEFRKLSIRSTEILYEKLNAKGDEVPIIDDNIKETNPSMQLPYIKYEKAEESDDDRPLSPELSNISSYIKPEPVYEVMEPQITLPSHLEKSEFNNDQIYEGEADEELLIPHGAATNSNPSVEHSRKEWKVLNCNFCNKQFRKQFYFDEHVRTMHTNQGKPFQCSNCSKSFTRYYQLFIHTKSKHIEKLLRCEYENCGASFALDKKLERHLKVRHNFVPPNNQEDHICHICSQKCSSQRGLRVHMKRHKETRDHVCQVCGVGKVTRAELLTHMRRHTSNLEKFPCPQCQKVFKHKISVSRHIEVVHEGLKKYKCTYCSKGFGTRTSLVYHERLHTGERPFTCEICRKCFVHSEALRSHMQYHNKNLRKYACKYCFQRLQTLQNLIDHEKRHFGKKPHICNVCSKGFRSEADLKNHCSTHSQAVGESQ